MGCNSPQKGPLKGSALFQGAAGSRIKPNAAAALLLFLVLWGGSLGLGRLLITPLMDCLPRDSLLWRSFAQSLRKVLICGIQISVFFSWVKFAEKRGISSMGFICGHKARAYWQNFFLGLGSVTAIVLALMAFGAIEVAFNPRFPAGLLLGSLCVTLFGWAVQSASEEIAMRGWLIPTLGARCHPLAAVLLTGGVFGAIHLFGSGATVLSLINLTLSGFFFALYAINAGQIWGVCGLHCGWNLAQGNLYGLSISGEPGAESSLFLTKNTGTDLLTGGAFGPEGGLVTTVFLACALLTIGLILSRKHTARPASDDGQA